VAEPKILLTGNFRPGSRRPSQWLPRGIKWFDLILRCYVLRVEFIPWRGYAARALYPRGKGNRARLLAIPRPEFSMKRIKPGEQAPQGSATHLAAVESNVFGKLGSLVAHVAVTRYDDGEPRRPGWFTIKTMGSAWVVQVKDPDSACSLSATAQSLDDALALADLLLSTDQAPWEPDAFLKRQNKK